MDEIYNILKNINDLKIVKDSLDELETKFENPKYEIEIDPHVMFDLFVIRLRLQNITEDEIRTDVSRLLYQKNFELINEKVNILIGFVKQRKIINTRNDKLSLMLKYVDPKIIIFDDSPSTSATDVNIPTETPITDFMEDILGTIEIELRNNDLFTYFIKIKMPKSEIQQKCEIKRVAKNKVSLTNKITYESCVVNDSDLFITLCLYK